MTVLVKGMEMPKNCSVCPMLEGDADDGLCHAAHRWLDDDEYWFWQVYPEGDIDDSKPLNCPLIEVPTPHGRLIDADALLVDANKLRYGEGWLITVENIENAPTVIEAEE